MKSFQSLFSGHSSNFPSGRSSLLPTGSPFSWDARGRALYIQALTITMMVGAGVVLVAFDGLPFVYDAPEEAVRRTAQIALGAIAFWVALYTATWLWAAPRQQHARWILSVTAHLHAVTNAALFYAMGPFSAPAGILMLSTLLLGVVLVPPLLLWSGLVGWLVSLLGIHFLSDANLMPFGPLFQSSLTTDDPSAEVLRRTAASAMVYLPMLLIGVRMFGVWRHDDRRLHRAAQLDSLTGAYTRRFATVLMHRAVTKARTSASSLSVVVFDLDRFKTINDMYGHAVGDLVLKAATKAVESTLRSGDVMGRFGGEEFVVLLPGADLNDARKAAERCCGAVASMRVPGVEGLRVTISLGVATHDVHGDSLDELIEAADQALYEAKAAGRNHARVARTMDEGPIKR